MAGVNRKHWLAFLSQDRVNMADQEPAPGVPDLKLAQKLVQPLNRRRAIGLEVSEQRLDLRQAHVSAAQHADQPANADLADGIAAVSGRRIDAGRPEQAGLVVDAERLDRQPGPVRELTGAEQLDVTEQFGVRVQVHLTDVSPGPKGRVKRRYLPRPTRNLADMDWL